MPNDNLKNDEKIFILLEKKKKKKLKEVLTIDHYKTSKLLNDSTISKFITKLN